MFIQVAGLRIHYVALGEGAPILLLHGWGTQLESLTPVIEHLARKRRVFALDFPGFGASEFPPQDWSVGDYTNWLARFLDQFGLEKLDLLGHSFGGRVAIKFSAACPERVSRLILIDSAGVRQYDTTPRFRLIQAGARLGKPLLNLLPVRLRKRVQWRLYRAAGSTDYLTAGRLKGTYAKVIAEDLEPFLPQVRARTLLIWGEADKATPLADARVMAAHIPDNRLVVIPNAGHYPFLDQPERVFAALDDFLQD
jgi:pimeloyl-ACP methyl ester carboxylesterase